MTGRARGGTRIGTAGGLACVLVGALLLVSGASALAGPASAAHRHAAALAELRPSAGLLHGQGHGVPGARDRRRPLRRRTRGDRVRPNSGGGFSAPFTVPAAAQPGEHTVDGRRTQRRRPGLEELPGPDRVVPVPVRRRPHGPEPVREHGRRLQRPHAHRGMVDGTPAAPCNPPPTYFGGVVIVGSNDHVLRGIVPSTGKVKWSDALDGPILAAPAEEPPPDPDCPPGPPVKIFAATDSSAGGVYGLTTSGRIMWHATMGARVTASILAYPAGTPGASAGPLQGSDRRGRSLRPDPGVRSGDRRRHVEHAGRRCAHDAGGQRRHAGPVRLRLRDDQHGARVRARRRRREHPMERERVRRADLPGGDARLQPTARPAGRRRRLRHQRGKHLGVQRQHGRSGEPVVGRRGRDEDSRAGRRERRRLGGRRAVGAFLDRRRGSRASVPHRGRACRRSTRTAP